MALSILDGNQSATTLSTILTSGQHITAHTVVSLGTQAITDMRGAVSGSVVSISNFPTTQPISIASVTIGSLPAISGTVTANVFGTGYNNVAYSLPVGLEGFDAVTRGIGIGFHENLTADEFRIVRASEPFPVQVRAGTVTIGSALPAGTNTIGVVTIGNIRRAGDNALSQLSTEAGSGYLMTALGAGNSQIGSVTASISGTVPVSISSVTVGNSVTIGSLPAISGTVTANGGDFSSLNTTQPTSKIQVGFQNFGGDFVAVNEDGTPFPVNLFVDGTRVESGNPIPISGTVTAVNHQGTSVTTSNFTSTTASTQLAAANAGREVLTIFNEGAGNLHICAGATCTTIAYQVRLSAGDYYEVPLNQTSLTHSAVFATAGTARVTQIS